MGNDTPTPAEGRRLERTAWGCVKCGSPFVTDSADPLRSLQPTLDPSQRIGRCDKCRKRMLFRHEGGTYG